MFFWSSLRTFLSARWVTITLCLLTAIFACISFWHIAESPSTWFDEGINFGIARSFAENNVLSLPIGPNRYVEERSFLITTNFPVLLPIAVAVKIAGPSLVNGRLPQISFMALFCSTAFILIRKKGGSAAAVFAVALVVSFVPFYGNGKPVLGEVPGLFYFLAGLLILEKVRTFRGLVFAGIILGLSAATKPFYLIVIPAVIIAEFLIARREHASFWSRFFPLALGGALPLVVWLATIVRPLTINQVYKTFFFYSNSYAASGFVAQVVANALRFFTEVTPIHFLALGLGGGVYLYKRVREHEITRSEIALLIFIVLTVGWYLKTPGWYRYFFPAHIIVLILFPLSVFRFLPRRLALLLLTIVVFGQFAYLATKRSDPLYNSHETLNFAAATTEAVPAGAAILVVNNPSVAVLLPGKMVYQYLQINPKLAFGVNSLLDTAGKPFAFIATDGHPEAVLLDRLTATLKQEYEPTLTIGRYTLYRHVPL